VNTETNYFMDSRLTALDQSVYSSSNNCSRQQCHLEHSCAGSNSNTLGRGRRSTGCSDSLAAFEQQGLMDILRVYYEFGPMVCGLVNLIDFVPRFQHAISAPSAGPEGAGGSHTQWQPHGDQQAAGQAQTNAPTSGGAPASRQQIGATESLTRLIRRSLGWFEWERKRLLEESPRRANLASEPAAASSHEEVAEEEHAAGSGEQAPKFAPSEPVNLKLCNLQVHRKVLLRSQLARVTGESSLALLRTRQMFHGAAPVVCEEGASEEREHWPGERAPGCSCQSAATSGDSLPPDLDLDEPFEVKFVRLAYVVPLQRATSRPKTTQRPAGRSPHTGSGGRASPEVVAELEGGAPEESWTGGEGPLESAGTSSTSSSSSSGSRASSWSCSWSSGRSGSAEELGLAGSSGEEHERHWTARHEALQLVEATNRRQQADELSHQLAEQLRLAADSASPAASSSGGASAGHFGPTSGAQNGKSSGGSLVAAPSMQRPTNDGPIGQLTYRLFAPCQLVNSSSCFSINPVNSSSPLARRGSVDLNGGGHSHAAELAHTQSPGAGLFGGSQQQLVGSPTGAQWSSLMASLQHNHQQYQQQVMSLGSLFPGLSLDHQQQTGGGGLASPQFAAPCPASSLQAASVCAASGALAATGSGAHQPLGVAGQGGGSQGAANNKFISNEFEPVEAIRRRMEIYVTTNSMKVLAGETLLVNLGDALSCLSTAIEQTVVRAPFARRRPPSTWVSVYVLYAAVGEPHLPRQLLEQQRQRDRKLALISEEGATQPLEEAASAGRDNLEPVFDDDFKTDFKTDPKQQSGATPEPPAGSRRGSRVAPDRNKLEPEPKLERRPSGSAGDKLEAPASEQNKERELELEGEAAGSLYNCAYERTVPLPSSPDDHLALFDYLEPVELRRPSAGSGGQHAQAASSPSAGHWEGQQHLWLDEHDLVEAQSAAGLELTEERYRRLRRKQKKKRKKKESLLDEDETTKRKRKAEKGVAGKKGRDDSQCSIM